MLASLNKNLNIIKLLLDDKADVGLVDCNGWNCAFYLFANGVEDEKLSNEIFDLLLECFFF